MYVRKKEEKRFVRRKSSSKESSSYYMHIANYKMLRSIAVILSIIVILPLMIFAFKGTAQTLFVFVDPALQESLMFGPANAYIIVPSSLKLSVEALVKPTRIWYFGDVAIIKAKINSSQLSQLLQSGVISIYGEKNFQHAPLYYLDPTQYPFKEKDADNELHQAYGPWTGKNVTVGIIDTGIDYTHPDFFNQNNKTIIKALASILYKWSNGTYVEWNLEQNPDINSLLTFDKQIWQQYGEPAFLDINGHGTHVAGIIAGQGKASNGKYKGIAPGASLVIIKAFNKNGEASMDTAISSLQWVYNNTEKYKIKILNLSWGASLASNGKDPISIAAEQVSEKGVWIFAAAGNEGNIPTTIVVPAVSPSVFAIGAWDPYHDKIAPFSSLGPTIDMRMKPDLMGAGVMIVSTKSQYVDFPPEYKIGNYYVALSGTSMATPAVAGVAADFIEYYKYWNHKDPTTSDLINYINNNARHINIIKDFITGEGIPIAPHT